MRQASKKKTNLGFLMQIKHRFQEAALILSAATAVFLFLSLLTYHLTDPGWSHTPLHQEVDNVGGVVGAWFADLLLYLFGYLAYLFPCLICYTAWLAWRAQHGINSISFKYDFLIRAIGFLLIMISSSGIIDLSLPTFSLHLPYLAGGILGDITGQHVASMFNRLGGILILTAFLLVGATLFSGISWIKLIRFLCVLVWQGCESLWQWMKTWVCRQFYDVMQKQDDEPAAHLPMVTKDVLEESCSFTEKHGASSSKTEISFDEGHDLMPPQILAAAWHDSSLLSDKVSSDVGQDINFEVESTSLSTASMSRTKRLALNQTIPLPSLSLLHSPPPVSEKSAFTEEFLERQSRELEQRLKEFCVEASVVSVYPGPVITRFELALAPGIKVSKISGLAKDLARALSTVSVRVVEVIPGKTYVGIEIPNKERAAVFLSSVLASAQYEQASSLLSLALGKDIAGYPVVVDLAKMPHLLVAGTTGSGKSVALNVMLLSLLYKGTPEDVRMILVDPKMLELSVYEGIPHLLAPVVTDMKEAANALRWCVSEMDSRYQLMAKLGVRNLAGFNQKVKEALENGTPIPHPFAPSSEGSSIFLTTLPQIVVLIDEFADMMMLVGKKVEMLIARLAQKARAAGIHLILATQRPSVDVITGLIKANIPTRIAFQVSSKIDSRTIIDGQGAEQLLGHGDMLYLPPGTGIPIRVHGAYVSDEEVHAVVAAWKALGEPNYLPEIIDNNGADINAETGVGLQDTVDELYDEAVAHVMQTRKVSISAIQRRFKIGYNRAARIVEDMETAGLVSAMESSGAREVLVPARDDV